MKRKSEAAEERSAMRSAAIAALEAIAERIARRAGSNAAEKGRSYNCCPYRSDRLALAWSEGHNAQRAAMLLNRYPRNIETDAPPPPSK